MTTHGGARPNAGRRKGSKATHTLEAQAIKQLYVELAKEHADPIARKLIEKALEGDMAAIKEFNDRVLGKAPQAITGANGEALKIMFDSVFNAPTSKTEEHSTKPSSI